MVMETTVPKRWSRFRPGGIVSTLAFSSPPPRDELQLASYNPGCLRFAPHATPLQIARVLVVQSAIRVYARHSSLRRLASQSAVLGVSAALGSVREEAFSGVGSWDDPARVDARTIPERAELCRRGLLIIYSFLSPLDWVHRLAGSGLRE